MTPVNPPIVNKNMKPKQNNIGTSKVIFEPHIVLSQENTFTPVGIPMISVAAV